MKSHMKRNFFQTQPGSRSGATRAKEACLEDLKLQIAALQAVVELLSNDEVGIEDLPRAKGAIVARADAIFKESGTGAKARNGNALNSRGGHDERA